MTKKYSVSEIFYSIQGEGVRAGTANVFVRFAGCNLTCSLPTTGFDCDTDFSNGVDMEGPAIASKALELMPARPRAVVFTGGEPGLQLDNPLVNLFESEGFYVAVETNGTKSIPKGVNWLCISPKTAVHTLRAWSDRGYCDELKYVLHAGMALPKIPRGMAKHRLISPSFQADGTLRREDLEWCVQLVKENPRWRLSLQTHKFLQIR